MIDSYQPVIDRFAHKWAVLSNFCPVTIEYEGIVYPSVEHAFQAAKTNNVDVRMKIADIPTAVGAKKAGKIVPDKVNHWFEYRRFVVMDALIDTKFAAPNNTLVDVLCATGNALLIEGNYWHDNVWGSCFCSGKWCRSTGNNALGRTLMRRRAQLLAD